MISVSIINNGTNGHPIPLNEKQWEVYLRSIAKNGERECNRDETVQLKFGGTKYDNWPELVKKESQCQERQTNT